MATDNTKLEATIAKREARTSGGRTPGLAGTQDALRRTDTVDAQSVPASGKSGPWTSEDMRFGYKR